jgi:hypothetical protein
MKGIYLLALLFLVTSLSFFSCATISEHERADSFGEIAEAYRHAMLASDFASAIQFIDPAVRPKITDLQRYKLVRIVDYKILNVNVADEHRKIEQDVALQYYWINISRLQSLQYHQVWSYDTADEIWLLQTDLPHFDQ